MLACKVMGHRYRFTSEGTEMRWDCQRGCGAGGSKQYASARDAARYATALDRDPNEALMRRPAMLSLLPLRLFGMGRKRR
jgi:hypothetical protein